MTANLSSPLPVYCHQGERELHQGHTLSFFANNVVGPLLVSEVGTGKFQVWKFFPDILKQQIRKK